LLLYMTLGLIIHLNPFTSAHVRNYMKYVTLYHFMTPYRELLFL